MNVDQFVKGSYAGYETRLSVEIDDELTRVGPETPCGEYLRIFQKPHYLCLK